MKILMVVTWYSPKDANVMSAGVFHYEQAMALKKYADVALYYPYDQMLNCDFSAEIERGLLTYRSKDCSLPRFPGNWILKTLKVMAGLSKVCQQYKPDIIHAQCATHAGRDSVVFGKLFGYPVIITEHNPIEYMQIHNKSYLMQLKIAYGGSAANICVSSHSANTLKDLFPKNTYQVIYNGISLPSYQNMDNQVYCVPGMINCGTVGVFYDRDVKGYQFLLPAVCKLKSIGIEIMLHICGGGIYLEYYQNMARELGIEANCIFYGQCQKEKVYSILSQMDFNISASIFECSGVSVQESMLLGKPLVVTRSGGANSLVTDETAIVVDRESTDALVKGIQEMIRRIQEFDTEAIQSYAKEMFEIDGISRNYMRLYEDVLWKKQ